MVRVLAAAIGVAFFVILAVLSVGPNGWLAILIAPATIFVVARRFPPLQAALIGALVMTRRPASSV